MLKYFAIFIALCVVQETIACYCYRDPCCCSCGCPDIDICGIVTLPSTCCYVPACPCPSVCYVCDCNCCDKRHGKYDKYGYGCGDYDCGCHKCCYVEKDRCCCGDKYIYYPEVEYPVCVKPCYYSSCCYY